MCPARILLVDDNRVNRKLLAAVLEADGHRVDEASSGREAVDGVRLLPYDLVLMDVQMKDMDGVEATTAIRALGGRRGGIPIVAISGDIGDDIAQRCRDAGMNEYLTKPINPDVLLRAVAAWARPREGVRVDGGSGKPGSPTTGFGGLTDHLSPAEFLSVIDDFSRASRHRMAEIRQAVADGELDRARRAAHDLSGSAANLGLGGLSRAAQALEGASQAGDAEAIRRGLDDIPPALEKALADLVARGKQAAAGAASSPGERS